MAVKAEAVTLAASLVRAGTHLPMVGQLLAVDPRTLRQVTKGHALDAAAPDEPAPPEGSAPAPREVQALLRTKTAAFRRLLVGPAPQPVTLLTREIMRELEKRQNGEGDS